MLTPMDDTLSHQIPTTFDHVGTSDPRFYDRHWFAAYDPGGAGALQATMATYRNMDVADAGFVFVGGGAQHNLRTSRPLRPDFATRCGSIGVEVVEPLRSFTIVVEPGVSPVSGRLRWEGTQPPHEEQPHFARQRGRVVEDYARFNQIGRVDGSLVVDGRPVELSDWWACRDHSWGVRPRMGGREPHTGPRPSLAEAGFFMVFLFFSTGEWSGDLHLTHRGEQLTYLNGTIRQGGRASTVATAAAEPTFHPGTRRVAHLRLGLGLGDLDLEVVAEPLGPAIAMPGLGYSGGFDDGLGLGVWRGEVEEVDVWDVSHPATVVRQDGTRFEPWHRIQPVRLVVRGPAGESTGTGSLTAIASGRLPHLGLE